MKRFAPIILLLLLTVGCQKSIYVQRTGSIDKLDSMTYDTLLVAQALLDNTKIAIQQGKLPASAKVISNDAGKAYNILRDCWIFYRATPNESTAKAITDASLIVSKFIAELRGLGVNP